MYYLESSPSDGSPEPADSVVTPNQEASVTDELLMNMYRMRRPKSPDLPSTVTKLETEDGCKVYIVGTAHFSKESQEDVTKVGVSACCGSSFTVLYLWFKFFKPV